LGDYTIEINWKAWMENRRRSRSRY